MLLNKYPQFKNECIFYCSQEHQNVRRIYGYKIVHSHIRARACPQGPIIIVDKSVDFVFMGYIVGG